MPRENQICSWVGILETGCRFESDAWVSRSGHIYNHGYKCVREIQDKSNE